MKIAMVGAGYVGLVSAAGFAETGNDVVCVDVDAARIEGLQQGVLPIFEPGLPDLVARNVAAARLQFTTDVAGAVAGARVVIVAVGTPVRSDGAANLSAVDRVAELVAAHAARELVLVLKSTVPVGTNARVRRIVKDAAVPVHVVSSPEFLKEGAAIADFMRPDRVVVGIDPDDAFARQVMERLYHPVMLQRERIVWMDPQSAELTKYVANTMLAMRISFMNEIAALCERVGADVHAIRHGVGSDPRIGSQFLYAGPGWGGSCFPKDISALVNTAHEYGVELELATATARVNERQKGVLARKLKARFGGDLRGARIAVWGLSFKPGTDDIRHSPATVLVDALLAEGATVVVHDPAAMPNVAAVYGERIAYAERPYEAAEGADALVLVTEWRQYQSPDFDRLKRLLRRPVLIDGRNVWSTYGLPAQGFEYEGIGVRA